MAPNYDEQEPDETKEAPEKDWRVVLTVTDLSGNMTAQDISDEVAGYINDESESLTVVVTEIAERP